MRHMNYLEPQQQHLGEVIFLFGDNYPKDESVTSLGCSHRVP